MSIGQPPDLFKIQEYKLNSNILNKPFIIKMNRIKKQKDGPDEGRTRDLGVISTTL